MTSSQIRFLKDEIWILAFGGALQRSGIYGPNSENERRLFRVGMRGFIEREIIPKYKNKPVIDDVHIQNLRDIIQESVNYKDLLSTGSINVGIAQKLLNLILKYYWVLGWVNEPPHFPIDRIIQGKLPVHSRITWTKMKTIEEYKVVIEAAREKAGEQSLAVWELNAFERR
ncbi:hypothetical protein [Leeuwenhoekiella sp. W20_SRS_FM14]|uniref:hypothetical protein n=1 Tax=Leeuwenhoekiella sp. W20_SRS_FM14 TaxID=3240270 RepID=UPI003F9DFE29